MYAYASSHTAAARSLVEKINSAIVFPLITLLIALALFLFIWGAFQYVAGAESEQVRETGRRHMIYGIIGMLIMLSAYAILTVATNTFGIPIPR